MLLNYRWELQGNLAVLVRHDQKDARYTKEALQIAIANVKAHQHSYTPEAFDAHLAQLEHGLAMFR
jgi:hypothetical protein